MKNWNDIEKELKKDSQSLSFQFDDQYWDEVEQQLPVQPLENIAVATPVEEPIPVFTFQEEYWDEVEQALDQKERKKRFLLYAKFAGGLAATFAFLWMAFPWQHISLPRFSANTNVLKYLKRDHPGQQLPTTYNPFNSVKNKHIEQTVLPTNRTRLSDSTPENNHPLSTVNDETTEEGLYQQFNSLMDPIAETTVPQLLQRELPFGLFTTIQASDFIAPHPTIIPKRKRIIASELYVTSGVIIAYAPQGNSTDQSVIGLGTSAGLDYQIRLKKWAFSAGVHVAYRNGLNNELRFDRTYYGARLLPYTETDIISYKALTRLEFPVNAYFTTDKHIIGVGVAPVFNAAVNSTYQRFNSYNDDKLLVKNNFGIREGIRKYDLKVQVSYARQLTHSLQLSGNFACGLTNQIDKAIITNSKGYRDISLGISLKYNFLRF